MRTGGWDANSDTGTSHEVAKAGDREHHVNEIDHQGYRTMSETSDAGHYVQGLVLADRRCPIDEQGDLIVYKNVSTGRILLMCDDVEETWWNPDDLDEPPADIPRGGI